MGSRTSKRLRNTGLDHVSSGPHCHLFKHEGELHAVLRNAVRVQEAVQFEVQLPAGVAFVRARRKSAEERRGT